MWLVSMQASFKRYLFYNRRIGGRVIPLWPMNQQEKVGPTVSCSGKLDSGASDPGMKAIRHFLQA